MLRRLLLVVLILAVSGCATHVATSGRIVIRDDKTAVGIVITEHDRALIAAYFQKRRRWKKAPPGLAKRRGRMPPGLAKRDVLPPGLRGRGLPADLEARLSSLPGVYVRIIIGSDIVLLKSRTRVVVDIYRDVIP